MKIIDSHFHIWDLNKLELAWIKKGSYLDKNFKFDDFLNEYEDFDFEGGIYIEVDSVDKAKEFEYIIQQKNEKILGLCLASKEHLKYASSFRKLLLRQNCKILFKDESFLELMQELIRFDIGFEACMQENDSIFLKELVAGLKNLKLILNHFANISSNFDFYQRKLCELAQNENVFIKLSCMDNFTKQSSKAYIKALFDMALNAFGQDRLIYGSNYPVSKLKPSAWIQSISSYFPYHLQEKIFYKNAYEFYKIGEKNEKICSNHKA